MHEINDRATCIFWTERSTKDKINLEKISVEEGNLYIEHQKTSLLLKLQPEGNE